jgi:hypothetical protein
MGPMVLDRRMNFGPSAPQIWGERISIQTNTIPNHFFMMHLTRVF